MSTQIESMYLQSIFCRFPLCPLSSIQTWLKIQSVIQNLVNGQKMSRCSHCHGLIFESVAWKLAFVNDQFFGRLSFWSHSVWTAFWATDSTPLTNFCVIDSRFQSSTSRTFFTWSVAKFTIWGYLEQFSCVHFKRQFELICIPLLILQKLK